MSAHNQRTEQPHDHPHEQEAHQHDHPQDEHEHNHPHDEHDHSHNGHDHEHEHVHGRFGWLIEMAPFLHGHRHGEANVDRALETNERGIWALKISFLLLGITALFQLIIVILSGSVGLLADTIHNIADAFTAVPLWIAFVLARRPATRRYTYGYGRAEDVAGVLIVLIIFLSALLAGYESYQRFFRPEPLRYVWWVMVAAIIGFIGNEAVAVLRITVGKQIGSAALIADGEHARVDGLTSLAVLIGALGSLFGFPLLDPIIGVLITIAILFIVKDTAITMWHRLMDAVDPRLVDDLERKASTITGVQDVHDVRLRWIGHKLNADLHITVDEDLSTWESHHLAELVRQKLFDTQPKLAAVIVHVDPCGHGGRDTHLAQASQG
jgi:cation diffusion facilitator family transporter